MTPGVWTAMRLVARILYSLRPRIAVPGARSAPEDTGSQPRARRDSKGRALGWPAVFGWCALFAHSALAYPIDYGPFATGQSPARFPLAPCAQVAREGPDRLFGPEVIVYGSGRSRDPRLRAIESATDSATHMEIADAQGRSLADVRRVSSAPGRPESILCGDVNGDARMDFVVPLWHHGNGLGALSYDLAIALSSRDTYRFWVIPTAEPGPQDVLRLATHPGAVIVKSSFRNNEEQDERKRHSYWVYNLIAVRDDELVVANELDSRFPKWVWYTIRPNHKPAASLSLAERERIWNLQRQPMFTEAPAATR